MSVSKFVISQEEFEQIKPKFRPLYIINSKQFKAMTNRDLEKEEVFSFKMPATNVDGNAEQNVDYIVLPKNSEDTCILIEKVINYLKIRFVKIEYAINLAADSGLGMLAENANDIKELIAQRDSLKVDIDKVYNSIYSKDIDDNSMIDLAKSISDIYKVNFEKSDDGKI